MQLTMKPQLCDKRLYLIESLVAFCTTDWANCITGNKEIMHVSISISTFCLNFITSLSHDMPTSIFGTLSYYVSISISTFVQIQKQLIFYLCGVLVHTVSISTLVPSQTNSIPPLGVVRSYSVSTSTFVQITNQLNCYLWEGSYSFSVCISTSCLNLITNLNNDITNFLLGILSYTISITFCSNPKPAHLLFTGGHTMSPSPSSLFV